MRLVHFPRKNMWVNTRSLCSYAEWLWRQHRKRGIKEVIRYLWNPTLKQVGQNDTITTYIEKARTLNVDISWVRYPTKSTRIQIFDWRQRAICKISKPNYNLVCSEIDIRKKRPGLPAPEIISIDMDKRAYVERWITADEIVRQSDVIEDIVLLLSETFYDISLLEKESFISVVGKQGDLKSPMVKAFRYALTCFRKEYIPVSCVHGDLTRENILFRSTQRPTIIDWEYSRSCLVSYDAWLFLYSQRPKRSSKSELSAWRRKFIRKFEHLLSVGLYGGELRMEHPRVLHLVHLIERLSFLQRLDQCTTWKLEEEMRQEIEHQKRSLRKMMK